MSVATARPASLRLPIDGMTCASCVGRVERALKKVPGVQAVNVNLATEAAEVEAAESLDVSALTRAVEDAGYQVATRTVDLDVDGMTCASCVGRVERGLRRVAGVLEAMVNLATERAQVIATRETTDAALLHAVAEAGYTARVPVDGAGGVPAPRAGEMREKRHLLIAIALSAPLVLPMLGLLVGRHWMLPGSVQWALATPVQFWLGARFYRAAWKAVRAGTGNMDLLVALGTSAAYGLSLYELLAGRAHLSGGQLYFEASAVVITLRVMNAQLSVHALQRKRRTVGRQR